MKFKLLLCICLLSSAYAHAQDAYERNLRFGLKGGVGFSMFNRTVEPFGPEQDSRLDSYKRFFRISGLGGISVDGNIGPKLSIGAEVLYAARGMAYRERNRHVVIYDQDGNARRAFNYFNYNIDYLEFPITLNYHINNSSRNWLALYAGMAPALKLHSVTKTRYPESIDANGRRARNEVLPLSNVRHFNNSLLLGVKVAGEGYQVPGIYGDLRLSHTLSPIFKDTQAQNGQNLHTQMLNLSLSVGYRF